MRNLNGEIIPWGESYDMVSEEGRNGILTNIMAGNEAVMNEHVRVFDLYKKDGEKNGFDSSAFNMLYLQFFPDADSLNWKEPGKNVGYYNMQGQIVLKNTDNKILVINLETAFANTIIQTYVKSGNVLAENPSKLYDQKAFSNGFLGISSSDFINYFFHDLASLIASKNESAEKAYIEKVFNSNLENLLRKITNDTASISKDLYNISFIIYPNY
jgi:hypothetical protein